jgi:hypothetical protein
VLELSWAPTTLLLRMLGEAEFTVIAPARNPVDTLLAVLASDHQGQPPQPWSRAPVDLISKVRGASPLSDQFEAWAASKPVSELLSLTAQWWARPATLRLKYESFAVDPIGELSRLAGELGYRDGVDKTGGSASVERPGPYVTGLVSSSGINATELYRQLLTADAFGRLMISLGPVLSALDYDPASHVTGAWPTAAEAAQNWQMLVGSSQRSGIPT